MNWLWREGEMAEWSKALGSGSSQKWRGFESLSHLTWTTGPTRKMKSKYDVFLLRECSFPKKESHSSLWWGLIKFVCSLFAPSLLLLSHVYFYFVFWIEKKANFVRLHQRESRLPFLERVFSNEFFKKKKRVHLSVSRFYEVRFLVQESRPVVM